MSLLISACVLHHWATHWGLNHSEIVSLSCSGWPLFFNPHVLIPLNSLDHRQALRKRVAAARYNTKKDSHDVTGVDLWTSGPGPCPICWPILNALLLHAHCFVDSPSLRRDLKFIVCCWEMFWCLHLWGWGLMKLVMCPVLQRWKPGAFSLWATWVEQELSHRW